MSPNESIVSDSEFHLSEARRLNLPFPAYSQQSGVPITKLRYWRKNQVTKERKADHSEKLFHRIDLNTLSRSGYVITTGRYKIEIPPDFREAEVSRLVRLLGNL